MFSRGLNRRLFISRRIEAVVVLDLIMYQLSAVNHVPFGCSQANDLRRFGVLYRSLDIDFQGVEAKINIPYNGVYHRDCAVMIRPGDTVDVDRFVADNVLVALAPIKTEEWE
ncbi:MAG: hypothetical protein HDS81_00715 [Bacteroidales bacterium]|nr:hypothetical protein [Bacteroidales bacterium]